MGIAIGAIGVAGGPLTMAILLGVGFGIIADSHGLFSGQEVGMIGLALQLMLGWLE